jgi:hypothetical protein
VTFEEMQRDFIKARLGVPSLPFAGVIVYSGIALGSPAVEPGHRNLLLFLGFWMIMPIGALLMKLRGEGSGRPDNPLFRLSVLARWMVLSTWAIHLPVWIYAPALFPLTVGIAFGLHWVVLSWSMGNSVGLIHLAIRTTLVLVAWHAVPGNRVGAVSAVVAISYLISIVQLRQVGSATPSVE